MATRFTLKPGDIFEVIVNSKKKYLQYLIDDDNCLNGNVIRVFKYEDDLSESVDFQTLIEKEVDFFCHTYLKGGVTMNVWKKVSNIPPQKNIELPIFRHTDEVASVVSKSYHWFIWKVGEKAKKIGELTPEYKHLPIAGIKHPLDILKKIHTGTDGFKYPE